MTEQPYKDGFAFAETMGQVAEEAYGDNGYEGPFDKGSAEHKAWNAGYFAYIEQHADTQTTRVRQ